MNIAAKEFLGTGIEWANAALSSLAKNHGGPEQLIADIYENGYNDGYSNAMKDQKMNQIGAVGVGAIAGFALGGIIVYFYKKSKSSKAQLEQQKHENARFKAENYAKEILLQQDEGLVTKIDDNIVTVDFKKKA
ncbi:TPA: hypothetical protein ACGO3Z_002020 [Streptococcus suis]|nr:hypothetical protein [Streptococcus suis]